jgi:hypothetical protein
MDGGFPCPEPIGFLRDSYKLDYQLNAIIPKGIRLILGGFPSTIGIVSAFTGFF